MSDIYKIIRDLPNSKDDVYLNGVLVLSSPWFPDYTSPYVTINADFDFYSMSNLVDFVYKGAIPTDIQNYKFELSGLFDTIIAPATCTFEIWDNSQISLCFIAKNVLGTYSSLYDINLTFDEITAVLTGLTYVSTAPAVVCDFTQLLLRFDSIDSKLLAIEAQINAKTLELYDSIYGDISHAKTTLTTKVDSVKSDTLNILGYSENVFAPAFLTLATKTDLEPLATQYNTNNFIEDNRVILIGILNTLSTKTDLQSITIDTTALATKTDLQSITIDTTTLATKDDILTLATKTDILNIDLPSLNGNGSEFIDGVEVKVFGRDTVYTVERSFMSLYSDNGYTVHYDLYSVNGYKCTVPEALLTKHVLAV